MIESMEMMNGFMKSIAKYNFHTNYHSLNFKYHVFLALERIVLYLSLGYKMCLSVLTLLLAINILKYR